MKIWLHSHLFFPSIGGVEEVGRLLSREFHRAGHLVEVTTSSPEAPDPAAPPFPFPVTRRPRARELLRLVRWAGIVFHNNISLQAAWPLLVQRRPWVIVHHTRIQRPAGGMDWRDHLKLFCLRAAVNVAVSEAMANALPVKSRVIPNPYDDETFRPLGGIERSKDLIFVGRLVSEKGPDLFLDALKLLRRRDPAPSATIVGDGPEMPRLKLQAGELGSLVHFAGAKRGPEVASLLHEHRILVVPSRWESFGLVALEAIACGCVVVGSQGGGLTEAVGPCGLLFPSGDVTALADLLQKLLDDPAEFGRLRAGAQAHLRRHQPLAVAGEYLRLFDEKLSCS